MSEYRPPNTPTNNGRSTRHGSRAQSHSIPLQDLPARDRDPPQVGIVFPAHDDPFVQSDGGPAADRRRAGFTSSTGPDPFGPAHDHSLPEVGPEPFSPDDDDSFSPPYGDRTPLTLSVQPIGTSDGSRSPLSDRPPLSSRPSFLGHDLPGTEAGLRPTSDGSRRSNSFSAHLSPLSEQAKSIMRNVSKRVVNLSNEPGLPAGVSRSGSNGSSKSNRSSMASRADAERTGGNRTPSERPQSERISPEPSPEPEQIASPPPLPPRLNPLRGRSLGIFGPDHPLRVTLCNILVHPIVELAIFFLIIVQTVILTAGSWRSVYDRDPKITQWQTGFELATLVIFIVYTVEIIARIIVSGFIINPIEYSTINRQIGLKKAIGIKWRSLIAPYVNTPRNDQIKTKTTASTTPNPSQVGLIRTFTSAPNKLGPDSTPIDDPRYQRRVRLAQRAFLRHSFNRLDFVAVIAYWIDFALATSGSGVQVNLYLFRMLSSLRILRLLLLTNGTAIILRSLKRAAPLLLHVAFLISFFWLIFAIIGVQSFKSSLRRTCVWIDPEGVEENFLLEEQFCGGHLLPDGTKAPWVKSDMVTPGAIGSKGYLCPPNSLCVEGENLYGGTIGFDNIFQSLQLVFVIMSSNTFSDLMYYLTDSDYLAAALFFAAGLLILYFWLINLLIAVITTSFQVIRDENREESAFANRPGSGPIHLDGDDDNQRHLGPIPDENERANSYEDENNHDEPNRSPRPTQIQRFVSWSDKFFVLLIAVDQIAHAFQVADMSDNRRTIIFTIECVTTAILDVEMFLRFIANWRAFLKSNKNLVDLTLAIATTIIILPFIRLAHPRAYSWLTIFQILRIYRVIIAVPLAKSLLKILLGNQTGLLNLFLFTFMLNFLAAIFAAQLFRHPQLIPEEENGESVNFTFSTVYISFLTMYQIMTSEGWSEPMYIAGQYTSPDKTSWITVLFFILWFILSNFIVLNMFIAVIQESFDVSEDEKRMHQVKDFLKQREVNTSNGNLAIATIFRNRNTIHDPTIIGGIKTESLLKEAVVKEFLEIQAQGPEEGYNAMSLGQYSKEAVSVTPPMRARTTVSDLNSAGPFSGSGSETLGSSSLQQNPPHQPHVRFLRNPWKWATYTYNNREQNPFYARIELPRINEELDPTQMAREALSARERLRKAQEEYLRKYPTYNDSLYVFTPDHPIRRFCQMIVGPSRGKTRVNGIQPNGPLWFAFSAFVYAAVVAMVVLACVVTPLYQKEYILDHSRTARSWFSLVDLGFALLFTIEALIKIIADGFIWTPNAYLRGAWSVLDSIVLVTLWINVIATLTSTYQVSRAVGAFKALRALRLLNVSDAARRTFHSVIIEGGMKVISAAFVSLGLLIPFAIYGVNVFMGQFRECNDGDGISLIKDCVGEYGATPYNWEFLAPRVAANPFFSFDNFGDSIFFLFQIVSQEGWSGVMWKSQSVIGMGIQPEDGAYPGNAMFFIIFNLLGTVFVVTLFISVFMRNYTEQTGVAYLTTEQRSWLELRKLLRQISPSRRPIRADSSQWVDWCHKTAIKKKGKWQGTITGLLVLHLILLCSETYPGSDSWAMASSILTMILCLVFAANMIIRGIGLGWGQFARSGWDLFSAFPIFGTLTTQILVWATPDHRALGLLSKLFLVSVVLLLIPRNDQLDQLFKTAAASLPTIMNLVATWFVLFLVYAIAFTQTLGLTKFGPGGSGYKNFRTVPNALVLLFRTSIGEGWNELMEEFAVLVPPKCTVGNDFIDSDCGSREWARFLFVTWSILSMYIFCNLLLSLIYESFSYVYQRSSGLSVLSRDEIRRFKQAWARFDPAGTGYISVDDFSRFLGHLTGVFDMKIYSGDLTVNRILEHSYDEKTLELMADGATKAPIDLAKLNERLDLIPIEEIRHRRFRLNMFYEEVLVATDQTVGVSFSTLLMVIAHYKLIDDSKSLRLAEFLHRRARLQRVDEAVRRNIVRGFLEMAFATRRFRRMRQAKSIRVPSPMGSLRPLQLSETGVIVPEIVVSAGTMSMLQEDDDEDDGLVAFPNLDDGEQQPLQAADDSPSPAPRIRTSTDVPTWERLGSTVQTPHRTPSHSRGSSIQKSPQSLAQHWSSRLAPAFGFGRRQSDVAAPAPPSIQINLVDSGSSTTGSGRTSQAVSTGLPARSPSDSSANHSPAFLATQTQAGGSARQRARTTTHTARHSARHSAAHTAPGGPWSPSAGGLHGAELLGVAEFLSASRNPRSSGASRTSQDSASAAAASAVAGAAPSRAGGGASVPASAAHSRNPSRDLPQQSADGSAGTFRRPRSQVASAEDEERLQGAMQDVLALLDSSAWGGAIKRSATRGGNGRQQHQ